MFVAVGVLAACAENPTAAIPRTGAKEDRVVRGATLRRSDMRGHVCADRAEDSA